MPHHRHRRLRGSILLLALASFALDGFGAAGPAVAVASRSPRVGTAHAVSSPVQSSAAGVQSNPAVAWDGTNFLVVWEDDRAPSARDVFATRVRPDGAVLDPNGILISTAVGDQGAPAVAWNGTNFLVVWQEARAQTDYDIVGARVSSAGTVLDPGGLTISTGDTRLAPSVASNGSIFLVVFQANVGGSTSIRAARVSGAGVVLDNPAVNVSSAPNFRGDPAVASNGSAFFAVWADLRTDPTGDIYGARISAAGAVQDPNGIVLTTPSGGQGAPSVAWNGSTYLAAWRDSRSATEDVYGTRVSSNGTVVDAGGIPISTAASAQGAPAVGALGSQFFVAWNDYRNGSSFQPDIFGARVNGNGAVLDASGIAVSSAPNGQFVPAVAGGGSNLLVTWQGASAGSGGSDYDIFAARVAGGAVIGPHGFLVSGAADSQTAPLIAFDGTNFLVVWTGLRDGAFHVLGARVSPTGGRLDGTGFSIASGPVPPRAPALIWNGNRYLVVWEQGGAIYGARVTNGGTVADAHGFRISPVASLARDPAVTWNGKNFLVVWENVVDSDTRESNIVGARVSAAGAVLDPHGIVITTVAQKANPAVASNGTSSLVVWEERDIEGQIRGARVTNDGSVLEPNGIPISPLGQAFAPDVASNGNGYQVVWAAFVNGNDANIYGTRVSSTGRVIDTHGTPISTAPGDQYSPVVAFNRRFLVLWRDDRKDVSGDIDATRMHDGVPQDVSGFVVAGSGGAETAPDVSAGPSDRFGAVYQRFVFGAPYNAYRAFLRTVAPK